MKFDRGIHETELILGGIFRGEFCYEIATHLAFCCQGCFPCVDVGFDVGSPRLVLVYEGAGQKYVDTGFNQFRGPVDPVRL
jgi:hypothetical protein